MYDHYRTLEVQRDATAQFQKLQKAYETLVDPSKRRAYDRTLQPVEHSAVPPRAESAAASATGNQYRFQTPDLQSQVEELCRRYETGQMAKADFEREYGIARNSRAYDRLPKSLRQRFGNLRGYGPGGIIIRETRSEVEKLCRRYETGQIERADFEREYGIARSSRAYDRLPQDLHLRFSNLHFNPVPQNVSTQTRRFEQTRPAQPSSQQPTGTDPLPEQYAISEAIIRDANRLAEADPYDSLLERFNDCI
jgi:curved DNA-binding protein CbpA